MKHKGPLKSLPEQSCAMSVWETPTNRRPPMWKRLLFGNLFRDCEPHVSASIVESSSLNPSSIESPLVTSKPNLAISDAVAVGVGPTIETAPEISSIDPAPEGVVETSGEEEDVKDPSDDAMKALSAALTATRLSEPAPETVVPVPSVAAPVVLNTQHWLDLPPPPPPPLITPRSSLPKVPKAPSSPRVLLVDRRSQSVSRPSTVSDRRQSCSSTGSRHRRSSGDWPATAVETLFLEPDLSQSTSSQMIPKTITPQRAQYVRAVSVLSDLATDIEDEEDDDDHIFDLSSDEEDNDAHGPLERSFSHEDSKGGDAGSASPTTVLSPPNDGENHSPVDAPRWMLEWAQPEAAAAKRKPDEEFDVNTTASCSTSSHAVSSSSESAWVYCPVEPKAVTAAAPSQDDPVIFTVGWAALFTHEHVSTTDQAEVQLPPITAHALHYIELLASGTLRSTSAQNETKTQPLVPPSQWSVRDACPQSLGKCLVLPMASLSDNASCCYILPVHISAHSLERLRQGKLPAQRRAAPSDDDYAPTAQQEAVLFVRFSMDAAFRMHASREKL